MLCSIALRYTVVIVASTNLIILLETNDMTTHVHDCCRIKLAIAAELCFLVVLEEKVSRQLISRNTTHQSHKSALGVLVFYSLTFGNAV